MKTSLLLSKINYFIIAVLLFSSFTLYAQPKREFRSTWFQTVWNGDWPKTKGTTSANLTTQKSELTTWFDNLKNANINAVSFQIRSMCDAMYPSDYAPWSEFLSGTRGTAPYDSFDFLKYAIEEAHSRGMELHVWLNPYRIGSRSNPSGITNDNIIRQGTSTAILNPGDPAVITHFKNVIQELVDKYDIDGIMFDDYFYSGMKTDTLDSKEETSYANNNPYNLSINDWRRENVNIMVKNVYDIIAKSKRPWIRFGIGPAGFYSQTNRIIYDENHENPETITPARYNRTFNYTAYNGNKTATQGNVMPANDNYATLYCDDAAWLKRGIIDYISPQMYWQIAGAQDYYSLSEWWYALATRYNRHLFASQSVSWTTDRDYGNTTAHTRTTTEIANQVIHNRTTDSTNPGSIFFNTSDFKDNEHLTYLKANQFSKKALPPAIDWKNHATLPAPTNVSASGTLLTWQYNGTTWTTYDGTVSRPVRFVIYKYTQGTNSEDAMANPANLLGFSYTTAFTLPEAYSSSYTYAVRTMDRYGNEFGAVYLNANSSYTIPADGAATFNTTAEWSKTQSGSDYLVTENAQRSIAVWEGTLFIPNTNAGTISMINAATGTLRKTLTLTGASGYSLFCIRITDKGEVLLGNSYIATSDLFIYRCDTTSGVCTSIGTITATDLGRTDYFDIYGNLTNGYIVAASNAGNTAYVSIKDGTIASTATLFSSAHTGATSVNAIKRNCNSFFVAGLNQQDHKLFIKTNNTSLASIAFGNAAPASITGDLRGVGGVCFKFKGREYYACAENRRGSIKLLDISAGVDNAIQIGSATADLGIGSNGCFTVGICAEVHSQYVMIYVLAPNNGLAAYKLTLSSPVETVSVTNNTTGNSATFNGTTSIPSGCRSEVGFKYHKLFSTTIYSVTATDGISFSAAASNLEALTYYVVRAYVKTPGGNYIYGGPLIFKTPAVPPTVTTSDATDITTTTAILHGAATKGTLNMTETGFAWKVSGGTYAKQAATLSSGTLTYTLTGLALGTTYYVKAYATTANGDTYGSEVSFTTVAVVPPTVTTSAATNVSYTTVTLNGSITKGDNMITVKGFQWKKASAADYTNVSKGSGDGTISENLSNLQPATEYTYRAYGTASDGTVYGENKTFTTLTVVPPTVTTSDTTNTSVSYTTATLSGTITKGSYDITAKGFEYKKSGTTEWTSIAGTLSDTALSANITGLHHNTTYTFRAFATTSTDGTTVYGAEKTLTTHYRQLIIGNGETKALSTPFGGDIKFYHGGQIDNTIDNTIEVTGVVQYVQSFTRNLWYTIIFPFDVTKVTYGKNQEILPYRNGSGKFLLKQLNDNTSTAFIERWQDTPTPPNGTVIAKNTPYIIQVQSLALNNREITFHSADATHSINNATFGLYNNGNSATFNYYGNNTLRKQTIGTCYIIQNQIFTRQTSNTDIPAFECYVQATPAVMQTAPYIGIMEEIGETGTTTDSNNPTLYPYTLQTWNDNENVYVRSTVEQHIVIYSINGSRIQDFSIKKGETVTLHLPKAVYLLIGSECEKPFKMIF